MVKGNRIAEHLRRDSSNKSLNIGLRRNYLELWFWTGEYWMDGRRREIKVVCHKHHPPSKSSLFVTAVCLLSLDLFMSLLSLPFLLNLFGFREKVQSKKKPHEGKVKAKRKNFILNQRLLHFLCMLLLSKIFWIVLEVTMRLRWVIVHFFFRKKKIVLQILPSFAKKW